MSYLPGAYLRRSAPTPLAPHVWSIADHMRIVSLLGVSVMFLLVACDSTSTPLSVQDSRYAAVYQSGQQAGMEAGRDEGYTAGLKDGEVAGEADGRKVGIDEGTAAGHEAGYEEGTAVGHKAGYAAGYSEGHDAGYDEGHDAGYDEGRLDALCDAGIEPCPYTSMPSVPSLPPISKP